MHSYNAILSLESLLTADSQDTMGLAQALAYTGLSALSYMSPQHEQMRGHSDHAAFLTIRNIMIYPEYVDKINEYRKSLNKTETSPEDIDEDKKRKRTK